MGKNPARKRRREASRKAGGRPSTFFIIALLLGVILLFAMFVTMVRRPVPMKPAPQKHASDRSQLMTV